jgi:tripartite-type tricarboxylate transporter receptor subunit TctC
MRRRDILGCTAAAMAAPSIQARAQTQARYPDRPIRVIVPFPAGGATDIWCRIATEGMAAELGQPMVVENRGGAGGVIGADAVAKAPPDGYTLLFTLTVLVTTPVVMRRFPYDPVNDFSPIGRFGTSNSPFCVTPAVPASVTTMAEFVEWGKGRDLTLGSYSPGTTGHAYVLMLAEEAGLNVTHVAYRGEAPLLQDMLAGQIHGSFMSMTVGGEMMRAGRIRPLASSGTNRVPSLRDRVPTLREVGFSDRFTFEGFSGMLAPTRVPQPILDRLSEVFRKVANHPETQARLIALDTVPSYQDPPTFRAQIERSLREWTEIADRLNLRVDG